MKILFLGNYKSSEFYTRYGHPSDSTFGGQRKISLLLRALIVGGHQIKIVSSAVSPVGGAGFQTVPRFEEKLPEGTVEVIQAPTVRPKPWGGFLICLSAGYRAWSLARAWKPDVIFSYNGLLAEAFGLWAVHLYRELPLVLEVDDLPGVRLGRFSPKGILDRTFWKLVLKRTSAFVLVNSQLRQRLPIENRPVLVLPGLIEQNLLALARTRSHPFVGTRFVLLYAGGLTVERGVGVLLDAVHKLPPNWQLVIAGGGPLTDAFKELSRTHPERCRFLGVLSPNALYDELVRADAVINTPEKLTDQAGVFPFKIFEYLVCGAHVISTALPTLEGCDINMIQRWSGNPDDLASVLFRSPNDFQAETPRRRAISDWVEQRFGIESAAGSLNQIINRCLP